MQSVFYCNMLKNNDDSSSNNNHKFDKVVLKISLGTQLLMITEGFELQNFYMKCYYLTT